MTKSRLDVNGDGSTDLAVQMMTPGQVPDIFPGQKMQFSALDFIKCEKPGRQEFAEPCRLVFFSQIPVSVPDE